MRTDLPIMILSHGDPEKSYSYDLVRDFAEKVLIICDDEDKALEGYKAKYGSAVRVFDKEKYIESCDTVDNFHVRAIATYARSACYDIAKAEGIRYFAMLDDDILEFRLRSEEDGSLKSYVIKDIGRLLNLVRDFAVKTDATTVGFSNGVDFIGGKVREQIGRKCYQVFVNDSEKEHSFRGTISEDENHSTVMGMRGAKIFRVNNVHLGAKANDSAGVDYGRFGDAFGASYFMMFYCLICRPDYYRLTVKDEKVKHLLRSVNAFPYIIGEEFKK